MFVSGQPIAPPPGDSDALVENVRSAALAMQRQSWEQGILGQAFLEEGRDDLVVLLSRASLMYLTKEGVPAALGGNLMDPLLGGEALRHAARLTGDPALHQAAERMREYILRQAPRAPDGAIYHTGQTVWSDSFFASARFLAVAGHFDEAFHQVECLRRRLWHPRKHLLAHIWNEPQQSLSEPRCWGGGNGWAAAALPAIIRAVPEDRPVAWSRLVAFLRELIDGCLAHQRSDGLFHNVVDDPDSFVETNLAQMLAYSVYESVRGGWLPAEYLGAAHRLRTAAHAKVDRDGFVQGVAGAPTFDRAGISPEGQAFFLLMEAAARKLA